ncbi:unnamed protein product [Pedinophyceae sp. YPF-701]|nr:unnamed protein product [Pedinophyceae sp. YPF-701]
MSELFAIMTGDAMPPKKRAKRTLKPAPAPPTLLDDCIAAVQAVPDADLPALLSLIKARGEPSPPEPAFDAQLDPSAIRAALYPHVHVCVRENNGNWHGCCDATGAECSSFYQTGHGLLQRVYDTGVRDLRAFGRCHAALVALADLTQELEEIDMRQKAQVSWEAEQAVLQSARDCGTLRRSSFLDRIRFVWRCLLRAAVAAEGGVDDLPPYLCRFEAGGDAGPLDQMVADARAHGVDVLNEAPSNHQWEGCFPHHSERTAKLLLLLSERRTKADAAESANAERLRKLRFPVLRAKVIGDMKPFSEPVPPDLIPDEALRVGACKLPAVVDSGAWKSVAANYTCWKNFHPACEAGFDSDAQADTDSEPESGTVAQRLEFGRNGNDARGKRQASPDI